MLTLCNTLLQSLGSLTWQEYIEIFGTIIGLIYMYFQYTAKPFVWYISVLNALPFIVLNFIVGNYASFLLFVYYLLVSIWAILTTPESEKEQGRFHITPIPARLYLPTIATTLALTLIIYYAQIHLDTLLRLFSDTATAQPSTAPFCDSLGTALSFVGMWLLSRKYLEQWLLWVLVNLLFIYVYLSSGTYLWAALFLAYAGIAVLGYFNWKKLMKTQQP